MVERFVVNAAPGFRMHVAPTEGTRDVAGPVMDMLFPQDTPTRSDRHRSLVRTATAARMLAHILKMSG